jgi:drug/metabolite transporter (DMT)-like permease
LMFARGHRLPRGRALVGAAVYGLLAFGGAFAFAFYALVELEAGFSQVLLAMVPLATILLAVMQKQESFTRPALVGSLVALIGVVTMSGLSFSGSIPIKSVLAALGSVVCFAEASLVVKRFPKVNPLVANAVGMSVGAVFLALVTLVSGNEVILPSLPETWFAIIYMVVIGSVVVFTLYVAVLSWWDASRANYGFVIIPIVTILASAWLLDEQLTWPLLGGGLLVLLGVYYGALHRPEPVVG